MRGHIPNRSGTLLRYLIAAGLVLLAWQTLIKPEWRMRRERAVLLVDPHSGAAVPPVADAGTPGGGPDRTRIAAAVIAYRKTNPSASGTASFLVESDAHGRIRRATFIGGTADAVHGVALAERIGSRGAGPGVSRTVIGPILLDVRSRHLVDRIDDEPVWL